MDSGISARPAAWLTRASTAALRAVEARGEAFTSDITKDVPMLAKRLRFGVGSRFEATQSVGSRVLPQLAMERRLVRGRPRGTWVNGQYRWVPMESWLDDGVRGDRQTADAQAELLRLWLAAFGPATETDIRWWAGWTARDARAALAAVPHVVVDLDGATRIRARRRSRARRARRSPAAALLPTLDPTTMGWKERDWYLGPHASVLFDSNGNAGPTVWWDGGSSAAGRSAETARSSSGCSRTSARDAVADGRGRGRARRGVARRRALLARLPAAVPARAGSADERARSLSPSAQLRRRAAGRSPWR